jgi:hypothetical protein
MTTESATAATSGATSAPERWHVRVLKGAGNDLGSLTFRLVLMSNLLTYGLYCAFRDGLPWVIRVLTGVGLGMHDAVLGGTNGIAPMHFQ